MSDIITRARKEWLEVHKSPEDAPAGEAWHYTLPCPPEVVAALLDVLQVVSFGDTCPDCKTHRVYKHKPRCVFVAAEAAIAKALEAGE